MYAPADLVNARTARMSIAAIPSTHFTRLEKIVTARHKKPKKMTPMQMRALKVGAMAPVSAGLLLALASGAVANECPSSRKRPATETNKQNPQDTRVSSTTTNASAQREWHGRQGNWQGDWRLDDNGRWQGQWTPVKTTTTSPSGDLQAAPSNTTVRRVLQLVNKERAAAGLRSLTLNSRLSNAAQAHSDEMARTGLYSHTGPDGSSPGDRIRKAGYRWSMWAENIHHRQGSPEAIMADWMRSPGHRANILNPSLQEIGIGVDSGSSYWTQNFASAAEDPAV
ncbi:CAP domain-containing protein [Streptomyces lavendulocolor]|uniref:CAP domain-containing protein n=1 Tax=Streptomyces lavendulocolor TaxID=67316 RepID=UPI0033F30307